MGAACCLGIVAEDMTVAGIGAHIGGLAGDTVLAGRYFADIVVEDIAQEDIALEGDTVLEEDTDTALVEDIALGDKRVVVPVPEDIDIVVDQQVKELPLPQVMQLRNSKQMVGSSHSLCRR